MFQCFYKKEFLHQAPPNKSPSINSLHWHFTANSLTADRNILFGDLNFDWKYNRGGKSALYQKNKFKISCKKFKRKQPKIKYRPSSCWRIFGWNFRNYRIRTIMNTLWYICNVIKIFSFILKRNKKERQRRLFYWKKYYNLLENEMNCLSLKCLLVFDHGFCWLWLKDLLSYHSWKREKESIFNI